MEAYKKLVARFTKIHNFEHVGSILGWDRMAMMPSGGASARADAEAEIQVATHELITDSALKEWLADAEKGVDQLNTEERANLREIRRAWTQANKLPAELVGRRSKLHAEAQQQWQKLRLENDWEGFKPYVEKVIAVSQEVGDLLAEGTNLSRYEALMDQYEPGMTTAKVDALFDDVKTWLPSLIKEVRAAPAPTIVEPKGPFAVADQKAMGQAIMKDLGFNFEGGRLDTSSHPFCGGVPEDIRLTTRYETGNFDQSLMGIIHETGHASYEQNRPREFISQPASKARSMGIHESQSLLFEMQIARSNAFMPYLEPKVREFLGDQESFAEANLRNLYRRVEPGFIRVDADEMCYPLHVILRYEIERGLVDGSIKVDDIPRLWDEKMMAYLGLDTKGNFKDGCMQDIHWSLGYVGYFPTYTLGAMYAAQFMAAVRKALGEEVVANAVKKGEFSTITAWLRTNVWSRGSVDLTDDLVKNATGEPLNPAFYRAHLEARYRDGK